MKKLCLALLPTIFLVACSNTDTPLTRDALVGEWICSTEYKDVNIGTIDFITLKADGSLKDDNYIFDHVFNTLIGEKVINYFQSPLRYLKVNEGTWNLSGNMLVYHLKQIDFKRLIWADMLADIQENDKLKNIEAEVFKTHSSIKEGDVKLTFNKFIKNGFVLNQNINGRIYESKCLDKQSSKHRYIEAYKEIHKFK